MKKLVLFSFLVIFLIAESFSQENNSTQENGETSTYKESSGEKKSQKKEKEGESMDDWIGELRSAMEEEETTAPAKEDTSPREVNSSLSDKDESEPDNFAIDVTTREENPEKVDFPRVFKRLDRIESLTEKTLQKAMEAAQRAGNAEALAKANRKVLNQLLRVFGKEPLSKPALETTEEKKMNEEILSSSEEVATESNTEENRSDARQESSQEDHFAIDVSTDDELSGGDSGEIQKDSAEGQETPAPAKRSDIEEDPAETVDYTIDKDGDKSGMTKKINEAIQAIRDTGDRWIKALEDEASETTVDETENRFHNAAGDALEVYREAAESGEEIDLLKALTDIHTTISETQNKANEIRHHD